MRLTSLVRRSVAVTAATALVTGGLASGFLATSAFAATPITSVSPNSANNNTTPSIVLTGSGFVATSDSAVLRPSGTRPEPWPASVGNIAAPVVGHEGPLPSAPSGSITITPNLALAAPGPYDIVVTQAASSPLATETIYECIGCFQITAFGAANVQQVKLGESTGTNPRGLGALDLTGSLIAKGAKVEFLKPGTDEVDPKLVFTPGDPNNASTNGYITAGTLRGTYSYTSGFQNGLHEVRIKNTDGNVSGVRSTLSQPFFTAEGVTPRQIGAGASQKLITITGEGFTAGSTVSVSRLQTDSQCAGEVTVGQTQVSNAGTTITVPVSFATCALAFARTITVTGLDGGYYALANALTSTDEPTVSNLAGIPQKAFGRGANVEVTINGAAFGQGPSAASWPVFNAVNNPGVTFTTTAVANTTVATVRVQVAADAVIGTFQVKATNPDGGSSATATSTAPLKINPAPVEKSISDPSGFPGEAPFTVVMTGTDFESGGLVVQPYRGTNVDGTPKFDGSIGIGQVTVTQGSGTADDTASFSITIAGNAAAGLRDLKLVNSTDQGSFFCTGCFGVDSLAVQDTAGSPPVANGAAAANNGTHRLRFFGSGITSASKLELIKVGDPGFQPHLVGTPIESSITSSSADANIDLTAAAPGTYNGVVTLSTNPLVTLSCSSCFKINGIAATNVAMTPATGGRGAVDRALTFTGNNLSRGMIVTIPGTTVHDVDFHPAAGTTAAYVTALVDVAADAATGAKDVVLRTNDGQNATTLTGAFTINEGPIPGAATPAASVGQGAGTEEVSPTKITLTVKGTGFVTKTDTNPGSSLDAGLGITVSNVAVTQGTTCSVPVGCTPTDDTLTADLVVAVDAPTGLHSLTVSNNDGGKGVLNGKLTIAAGPKPTNVLPLFFSPGASQQAFTINGAGFVSGAVPKVLLGNGTVDSKVTLENITFVDATKITATVTVAADAVKGLRTISVGNTDKGYGTCSQCLAIATPPSAPRSLVVISGPASLDVSWLSPLDNGGAQVTGYLVTAYQGTTLKASKQVAASASSATLTGLVNGTTYTVKVQAINVAGNGEAVAGSGVPGKGATLTNVASSKLVTAGTVVTFRGKLTSGSTVLDGRTVSLRFTPKVGSAFTRTVTTDATGAWTFRYATTYTFTLKASYAGDATYRPASSGVVTVTVAAKVTVSSPASSSTSSASTTIRITGSVSPNKRGTYVYLYRYVNGSKTAVARATLTSSSTFVFVGKPPKGTYTFRVYVPTTTGNAAGYSAAFTIKRV